MTSRRKTEALGTDELPVAPDLALRTPHTGSIPRLGVLGAALGLGVDERSAIRRHAMRLESLGNYALALEAYRVSALSEPLDASNWLALARCYRALGDDYSAARVDACGRVLQERIK